MEEKTKKTGLKLIFSYLKPHKADVFVGLCAMLVSSTSILLIPHILKNIIDKGLAEKSEAVLDHGLLILISVTSLMGLASFCRFFFMTRAGEKATAAMRRDLFSHLLKLSADYYEKNKVGDIISRLTLDIGLIQQFLSSTITMAMRHMLTLSGGLLMLFVTSTKLSVLIFAVVPVVVFPIIFLGKRVRKNSKLSQEAISMLASHAEENVAGIKTVHAFIRESYEVEKFESLNQQALAAAKKRILNRSLLGSIVIFLVFSGVAFLLWKGGVSVLKGDISSGELFSFLLYSGFVAGAVGALSEVMGDMQRTLGAADRLSQLLEERPSIADNKVSPVLDLAKGIEFRDVVFSYPSTPEIQTLKHISISINKGEKVAVVGPSGAGKTTLFELLLRFYEVKSGEVLVGGQNVADLSFQSLRGVIGIVPQDPIIFSDTAYENIRFGKTNATKDEILSASDAAAASEFINKMPNGFDTYLGEKGVRLSGGQKQRIAIARAILKNPPILLLDEATSALDSENEQLVQNAIEALSKNRTTIIIAHRLSTIISADKIIVLDNGSIEAVGTHAELLEKSALYKKLAEIQFK